MKPKRIKSLLTLLAVLFLFEPGLVAQAARGYHTSKVVDGFYVGCPEFSSNDESLTPYVHGAPVKDGSTVTVTAQVVRHIYPTNYTFEIENFSCTREYKLSQSVRKSGDSYTVDLYRNPGHTVDSWSSTGASSHKGKCKFCNTTVTEAHVYDNNCDTTCNICGYVRTITHDYRAATCLTPKKCSVCGTTDGTALGHSYTDGVCSVCGMEETSGVVHITTAEQLNMFADTVFGGQNKLSAVLDNDIDMSAYPNFRIGTSTDPFEATFDGQEHTLKVALVGEAYTAPFGFIGKKATVKNLIVEGTVKASGKYASGLIACISESYVTVQNCISLVDIISTVDGDGTHGGLVGLSSGFWPEIYNCAFLGSMTGEKTVNCGGLIGWVNSYVTFKNCLLAAKFDEKTDTSGCNTFARYSVYNSVSVRNCYYLNKFGSVPTGASQITSAELKSGEVAYKLNGSQNSGANWYQNLDNGQPVDEFPVPYSTHGAVYYGYANCETDTKSYTNNPKTEPHHRGGAADCLSPGYCSDCGESYIPIDPNTHRTDEVYYTYTDTNTHGEYHACCDAFIAEHSHSGAPTCTNSAYCDICKTSYGEKSASAHTGSQNWIDTKNGMHALTWSCCGTVDETKPHSIVYSDVDDANDRIVITCSECGETGTVVLKAEDTTYTGYAYKASYTTEGLMSRWKKPVEVSLTYCHAGGCKTAGTHTVTMHVGDKEVTKEFTITPKKLTVTKVRAFSKSYDMTNEVFVNAIDLDGIVIYQKGDYASLDIKDNVAIDLSKTVVTVADSKPGIYDKATIANITLSGADKDNYSIEETVSDIEIKVDANNYEIWNIQILIKPNDQTLYGDDAVLDQTAYTVDGLDDIYTLSGEFLYEDTKLGKIRVNAENIKITYGDEDVKQYFDITDYYTGNVVRYCENHYFDEDGFCATGDCDSYAAAILITKENCEDYGFKESEINEYEPKYAIYNGGQLYWFADRVNNYNETAIVGVLADDIKVNEDLTAENLRVWTPIANDSMMPYGGSFYGNGHTVSGLYCKNTNTNGYVGFFGNLGYYPVSDLHIANSYFEGYYAGGIAGYSNGAATEKCSVSDDVTVKGTYIGGIYGYAFSGSAIENCFSLAKIDGTNYAGGLVGSNYTAIKNCYTDFMQPVGASGGEGSFENVYYTKDTRNYTNADGTVTQKPTFEGATEVEDFANGEAAYKLQSGVKGEISGYDGNDEPIYGEAPQIWGQKIGTDKYPTFSTAKVYKDEYNGVNAYRNEIDGYKIVYVGKNNATVVLDKAGTYAIVLADYENGKLANAKTVTVTVTEAQAVCVASGEDFTFGTGDKVMLWADLTNLKPLCKAYSVGE